MKSHAEVTSVTGDKGAPLQKIARRIAFLLGSNLMCWILSIYVNAILVSGYYVPGIVLQWMAILQQILYYTTHNCCIDERNRRKKNYDNSILWLVGNFNVFHNIINKSIFLCDRFYIRFCISKLGNILMQTYVSMFSPKWHFWFVALHL